MLASAAIPGEEDLPEELVEDEPDEEPLDWSDPEPEDDERQAGEAVEDPNAAKRFWFEHATGAGKTVAALGFVEASRTGGILILTHRRNLVDQFHGELRDRGYAKRISPALLSGHDNPHGPVTVETYQWFVRNAGKISDAYTIVICDEAHTALGEKTSAAIRDWSGPVFVGMTATGALIARHVTDLFPTQTSRFDLAQAARRGVIAPLRAVRIPPGPGVRTIAKVPLRRGEVDTEFDQEMLAELLDQMPFNLAIADLYKTRFNGVPGVVYSAGVRHAYNVAQAFRDSGMKAQAVSGETKKRELARILAAYERGDIDVLVNAQLLAEGWNSPRATVCMHLAPTASKRIYQQRVGRVTRRHPGKEAGIVVDFVHPATKHDDPVVTLHSLLGPRRLPRRRDRRRPGAPRPRAPAARRAPRGAGDLGREPPDRGLRARAVADRRRAPRLRRAGPVGRAGGRARGAGGLAAGAGDAPLRRGRRAQARLPADRRRAQQEPAAAPARAAGDRRVARRRGVRPRDRDDRRLAARGEARGRQGRPAVARREEDRPPRPGQQLDLGLRGDDARDPRGVRGAALAGDQAPARAAGQLDAAAPTRATRAGSCTPRASRTAGCRPRCSPRRCRTPPRPARSSTAPAPACPASRPRSRASCCATSRRAARAAAASAAARRARAARAARPRRSRSARPTFDDGRRGDDGRREAEAPALARRRRAVAPRPRARQARGPGRRRRPGGPRGGCRGVGRGCRRRGQEARPRALPHPRGRVRGRAGRRVSRRGAEARRRRAEARRALARARRSPPRRRRTTAAAEEKPKPKRARAKPATSAAAKPKTTRAKAASTADKPKRATRAARPRRTPTPSGRSRRPSRPPRAGARSRRPAATRTARRRSSAPPTRSAMRSARPSRPLRPATKSPDLSPGGPHRLRAR